MLRCPALSIRNHHALAYNLVNCVRTLALPEAGAQWSLTSLWEKLVKIRAKVVRHVRYAVFQVVEAVVPTSGRSGRSRRGSTLLPVGHVPGHVALSAVPGCVTQQPSQGHGDSCCEGEHIECVHIADHRGLALDFV
ncbi:MAG: hypothetical protein EXR01_01330 [Acetobacteraceae bacterium]|nr:hypothetical protein [Acetobacteraceae bacterium]